MRPVQVIKIVMDSILTHISNVCSLFYVNTARRRFGEVMKNATNLSQHEALKGAHVHEMTLCVTFGALRFGTHFRLLARCSNYAVIHITLGTHVPQTTLHVTFGARPRSIPLSLLDRLFGHLGRQGRPRTPERFRRATVWAANVAQGCPPDLTSARPRLHPDLRSGIFRRRERRAHEVARRHRAGSGDWENPKREGAKCIPGLPVVTGPP